MLVADLATEAGVAAVVAAIEQDHCALLVNNAGFGAVGEFAEVPLDKQVQMLRVNVEAPVVLAHAFLRQAVRGDALVNVSSVVAFMPQPDPAGVQRHQGVHHHAERDPVAERQAARGMKVFAVHPGATDTEFARARPGATPAAAARRCIRQLPEEVAAETLRALEGPWGPDVVTGLPNRLFCSIARLLPRKLLLALVSRLAR